MDRNLERGLWGFAVFLLLASLLVSRSREAQEAEGKNTATQSAGLAPTRSGNGISKRRPGEQLRPGALVKTHVIDWEEAETPEELAEKLSTCLAIPSSTERFQQLVELLDHVTPDNWNQIWETYVTETLNSGRVHGEEWVLVMKRIGEVAGPEAITFFEDNGQEDQVFNRNYILKGWAARDPEAAIAWVNAQDGSSDAGENTGRGDYEMRQYWSSIVSSVAETDPAQAYDIFSQAPPETQSGLAASLFQGITQTEGMGAIVSLLEEEQRTLAPDQEASSGGKLLYGQLVDRIRRMSWLANDYPEMENGIPDVSGLQDTFANDPANQ